MEKVGGRDEYSEMGGRGHKRQFEVVVVRYWSEARPKERDDNSGAVLLGNRRNKERAESSRTAI